ncbi:3-oxoacyl-acyl-carrier-protein reductase [Arthroderma uncinatum]|uniref:3-oxoacyl-acyl-carrier-protein reductase n=1 Tax=Arthroderma uncinatum TaxID=74035 RepID=UPI00144AB248|nr:3-oxoacyl-acyl-carrier-protein reductase [Arthroderma uncinatum]KAF3491365.1 3-oxoacyl-acyl-carrier-protein reductase [Arthroderma uncinatum]
MPKVWLITGCSSGFGKEIALAAARNGDIVIATARDISKLEELKGQSELIKTKRLDVLDDDTQMQATIADIIQDVGRIDILVNNAGYILVGAIEECSLEEIQKSFATNVFGQMNVLRAVIPRMREQKSGTIANLGSIGGWAGGPSAGIYCATKAAIAIYTESLRGELASANIEVVCIEPGYFRTNFLEGGHRMRAKKQVPEVSDSMNNFLDTYNKKQPGDPQKGANLIVQLLGKTGLGEGKTLPARLALGKDAVSYIGDTLSRNQQDLDEWKDIVSQTNCDDVV